MSSWTDEPVRAVRAVAQRLCNVADSRASFRFTPSCLFIPSGYLRSTSLISSYCCVVEDAC